MAIVNITIEVNCEWFKEAADLTECQVCGETMVTNTNSLYVFADNVLCSELPALKLCNSCCECLNDTE